MTATQTTNKREIVDSVQILYEKLLAESAKFVRAEDRESADRKAKKILDDLAGDNQVNRLAMLRLWLDARDYVAHQDEILAEIKADEEEKVRFEEFYQSIEAEWRVANTAWTFWVTADPKNVLNRQTAMNRKYWMDFAAMEQKVLAKDAIHDDGKDAGEELLKQLKELATKVAGFKQNFCETCGAPVFEITPKGDGKKPFMPKLCGNCHKSQQDDTDIWSKPAKHVVKKKGSAAKKMKSSAFSKKNAVTEDGKGGGKGAGKKGKKKK